LARSSSRGSRSTRGRRRWTPPARLGPLRDPPDGGLHEERGRPLKARRRSPVTTNMMTFFGGLDYWRFTDVCDRMAWEPTHSSTATGAGGGPVDGARPLPHDEGGLPFLLMESTPSNTNWQPTPRSSGPASTARRCCSPSATARRHDVLPVAEEPGAFEKMHGAVVDHEARTGPRLPGVAAHGALLRKLDAVVGTTVRPEVAIVNDWESRWRSASPKAATGRGHTGRPVRQGVHPDPHRPLPAVLEARDQRGRDRGLSAFDRYKLVVAPMLFMLKPESPTA